MAMSSYELVRRAIEFDNPDRIPLRIVGDERSDAVNVDWNYIGPGSHQQRETYDEWGCLWIRTKEDNMGQVKGHPLAEWSALDTYHWPDPDVPAFYEGMEAGFERAKDKYVISDIFMLLFERMQSLRGFENVLVDLYIEREKVEDLADRIVEFDLAIISNLSSRFGDQIHGFWMTEDWGTQQGLMINPALWRDFFKPRYKKIFSAIKEAGWHVWLHCDGKINVIIDDWIDLGVDVLNLMSPILVGIDEIGSRYRGKICFEASVDLQLSLPFKSAQEIELEAQELLQKWATPAGGFVLTIDSGDHIALDISVQTCESMLQSFIAADPWKK
jgi:hypothetical protein